MNFQWRSHLFANNEMSSRFFLISLFLLKKILYRRHIYYALTWFAGKSLLNLLCTFLISVVERKGWHVQSDEGLVHLKGKISLGRLKWMHIYTCARQYISYEWNIYSGEMNSKIESWCGEFVVKCSRWRFTN